jgi:hypothetical protein
MEKISIDFSQRDEDELAFLNGRVRDLELFGMNFGVIKKNIQVNRSGSPSKGFCTTH